MVLKLETSTTYIYIMWKHNVTNEYPAFVSQSVAENIVIINGVQIN